MDNHEKNVLVIFGATGDLTYRKLVPALYSLYVHKLIPENLKIIGTGRKKLSQEDFNTRMKEGIVRFTEGIVPDEEIVARFISMFKYFVSDMSSVEDFNLLKRLIVETEDNEVSELNCIFYLAVPPGMYTTISERLYESGLSREDNGYRRFVYEKPFGYDLWSCRELNKKLHSLFKENQIYRIDHYLGKETVQNILVTRFSNGMFEPLWNRNYIHHVEITSAESLGVENRGSYYDTAGALRDMVQNHMLQIVGLAAMEPPSSLNADAVRNEVLKVFQSLHPVKEEEVASNVIRGQYTASMVRGQCLPSYRQEPGVDPNSRTETYVAMKFFIDNWRWGGVPFYIRTGKRLPTKVTEIVIHFKPTPHFLFHINDINKAVNQMIIRIQPDEGILLKFGIKKPGGGYSIENVNMDFHYSSLSNIRVPEAYERLLADVFNGDSTLYARDDIVETAWSFLEPVQTAWSTNLDIKIFGYPAGTWGPENADRLIEGEGLTWRYPCRNLADDGLYCEL